MKSIAERLEAYITNSDMIYIDACSLRKPGMPKFYDNVKNILQREGKKIICPEKVWEEIKKYMDGNSVESEECRRAQKYLQKMYKRGILYPKPAEDYEISHADHGIKADFNKYYVTNRMLLITNDNDLASNVLDINNDTSVRSKYKIHAAFIHNDGYLAAHKPHNVSPKEVPQNKVPQHEIFPLGDEPQNDEPRRPSSLPKEGDAVHTEKGGVLHLVQIISCGGEGTIYSTDAVGCVAKIFRQEYCSRNRYEKLQLMLSKPISHEGICWPIDILTNENGEFVGYLMPQAKGDSLRKVLMKRWLVAHKWERKELIALCLSVLDKLAYLQERNVITVDYNPNNILVQPNGDTWIVDIDSCQVGCYPAVVDTKDFTPPEIYHRRDAGEKDILFSNENVNFSTAILLFKILVPGQHPLHDVRAEARTAKDDILEGIFPYRVGEKKMGKPPKGVWQKCWSHLSYKIKETFWNTFNKDGKLYAPSERYNARQWQSELEIYQKYIDKMSETDANSLAAFPTSFKKSLGVEYACCRSENCNCEEPKEWLDERGGFCEECARDIVEEYNCSRCGKEMVLTNYDVYVKKRRKHKCCNECYEALNQVYTKANCIDCGQEFEISIGDKDFYEQKRFSLPKRCSKCRELKRDNSGFSGFNDLFNLLFN